MNFDERRDSYADSSVLNDTDKDKIIKLHKKNKDDVPQYLDTLKKKNNLGQKEADYDNEFLKYMI